jgi:unsaturated rhamnogalacturonyl hydrolase
MQRFSSASMLLCVFMSVTAVLVGHAAAQCTIAKGGGGWMNTPFPTQSGSFTATFDAVPSASPSSSVIAFSNGAQNAYAGFATLVRFSPAGVLDVRNGGAYDKSATISYEAGVSYHFQVSVNIPAHTYSVLVTPSGGTQQLLANTFAFRTEQDNVGQLNWVGAFVGATTGSVSVCNFAILGDAPDFTLAASPGSQTITAGASATYSVNVGSVNGFSGSVALSVIGLPSGASASFSPPSVSGSGTSVLSVSTSGAVAANSYPLTITGASGGMMHSVPVALNVTSGGDDFALSAMPGLQTITAGNSTSYTVTVAPQNNFHGSVFLSAAGLPTGSSASFSPTSVTGSGTSALSVSTSSAAATGTSTLSITGSSGSLTHQANVALAIKPPTTGTDWSVAVVESTMKRTTPGSLSWSYPHGLFLHGMYLVFKRTRDPRYLQFIQSWADRFVDSSGNISNGFGSLDSMQPVVVLLDLFQETGLAKYRIAAGHMRARLNTYPRTSDGGFWHTTGKTDQLWGDGTFMLNPGLARYGQLANDPSAINEAAKQLEIYASHLQITAPGPSFGLLFHAYDQTRTQSWANKVTGDSPEVWCRAMGWYAMATIEVLEVLPANDPHRPKLISILHNIIAGIKTWQDPATGRWFQVVNKPTVAGNFTETSSSSMYTYVISRAVERGYVDSSFLSVVQKGYQGVLQRISLDSSGMTNLTEICIGTNVGDLAFYLARPRATNDFHGLGAFLIMNEQLTK